MLHENSMTQFEDRKGFTFQEETEIVNKVVSSFTTYNDARSSNLEKANSLINEIFFKNTYSSESDKHKLWKSSQTGRMRLSKERTQKRGEGIEEEQQTFLKQKQTP